MTESVQADRPSIASGGAEPLPRCCPRHNSWSQLSEHLLNEFPELPIGDVVREIRRAKDAVEQVSLDEAEGVELGELIVRHQLLVLSGRMNDVARLDPERHSRSSI